MSNSTLPAIQPALTFRPLSPFLVLLIEHANARSARPEELAPASVTAAASHLRRGDAARPDTLSPERRPTRRAGPASPTRPGEPGPGTACFAIGIRATAG